jgi:nicotinate-nucleotide adenylyltransferase
MNNSVAQATPLLGRGRGRLIGIFGGSFNPIHVGHIALAQAVLRQCGLDEVWLMVSPQNPLKRNDSDLLADSLRFEMAQKALEDIDGVVACDYEFRLPKPSYTWNTLRHLSKDYPDRQFVLLMGGDNWEHFDRWYHYEDIKRCYEVAVYTRTPGEPGFIDISSTEVRERIKAGKGIRRLVPKAVADYIKEKGLYKGTK